MYGDRNRAQYRRGISHVNKALKRYHPRLEVPTNVPFDAASYGPRFSPGSGLRRRDHGGGRHGAAAGAGGRWSDRGGSGRRRAGVRGGPDRLARLARLGDGGPHAGRTGTGRGPVRGGRCASSACSSRGSWRERAGHASSCGSPSPRSSGGVARRGGASFELAPRCGAASSADPGAAELEPHGGRGAGRAASRACAATSSAAPARGDHAPRRQPAGGRASSRACARASASSSHGHRARDRARAADVDGWGVTSGRRDLRS